MARPLTRIADGTPYVRPAVIETQIDQAVQLSATIPAICAPNASFISFGRDDVPATRR